MILYLTSVTVYGLIMFLITRDSITALSSMMWYTVGYWATGLILLLLSHKR